MRTTIAMVLLLNLGCDDGLLLGGEPIDAFADAPLRCSGHPDAACDDLDPCTFDLCDVSYPCAHDDCEGHDEGPLVCWHLPADIDSDGYATAAGECAVRGTPWTDCDDGDSAVRPGLPEVCGDGRDNDCDGTTDCL